MTGGTAYHIEPSLRIIAVACLPFLIGGCSNVLVYGERTGLNLSISSDAAKSRPIEINTGFHRQVVGIVPPRNNGDDGEPKGDAVSMFSHFSLESEEGSARLFDNKVTIRAAFASGLAAVKIAGGTEAEKAVSAIVNPVERTLPSDPERIDVIIQLINCVSTSEANARVYNERAAARGIQLTESPIPALVAEEAITNRNNAVANRAVLQDLQNLNLTGC